MRFNAHRCVLPNITLRVTVISLGINLELYIYIY